MFLVYGQFLLIISMVFGGSATELAPFRTEEVKSTEPTTCFYDEVALNNIAHQVDKLNWASENTRMKIELASMSLEKEFATVKPAIAKEFNKSLDEKFDALKATVLLEILDSLKLQSNSSNFTDITQTLDQSIQMKISLDQKFNALKDTILQKIQESLQSSLQSNLINFTESITSMSQSLEHQIQVAITTSIVGEFSEFTNSLNEIKELLKEVSEKQNAKPEASPQLQTNCALALRDGGYSGVYKIHLPNSTLEPFDVYCLRDVDNGPAWTVVQRRQDGSENFYRNWSSYKSGFGKLDGDFFIGLEKLYALTNKAGPQQLWIKLDDWNGESRFATYEKFAIGDEYSRYELTQLGKYSGDVGDSLKYNLGKKFSAKDFDNDNYKSDNCAVKYRGAWWFTATCGYNNLNGQYLHGSVSSSDKFKGILWYQWRDYRYSYKYAHMAIRQAN